MYVRVQFTIGDDEHSVGLEATAEPISLTDCRPGAGIQYAVQQMMEGLIQSGVFPVMVAQYKEIAMPGFSEED